MSRKTMGEQTPESLKRVSVELADLSSQVNALSESMVDMEIECLQVSHLRAVVEGMQKLKGFACAVDIAINSYRAVRGEFGKGDFSGPLAKPKPKKRSKKVPQNE